MSDQAPEQSPETNQDQTNNNELVKRKGSVTSLPPGGQWNDRHPSFSKTLNSLFRRSFLVKIRDAGTIVTEIIATVIILILLILWTFATTTEDAIIDPPELNIAELFDAAPPGTPESFGLVYALARLIAMGKGGNFVAYRDNDMVHKLVNDYYGAALVPNALTAINATHFKEYINISELFAYVNTYEDISANFNAHDAFSNAIAVNNEVKDPLDTKWLHNLDVNLFENQNFVQMFDHNLIACMYQDFGGHGLVLNQLYRGINQKLTEMGITQIKFPEDISPETGFAPPNLKTLRYSKPEYKNQMPLNMAFAFFSAIPAVLASMPDLTMILQDKESKMMTFILLMGAPESAYYLVSFVSTIVMCIVPYLFMDILFVTYLGMKGTNWLFLFIFSLLFIISQTIFQLFLSTFFTKSGTGRIITVVLLIFIIFFGYLNEVFTMDGPEATKHIFSLLPFETYELVISVMYEETRNYRPGCTWKDFTRDFKYPLWYGFMWLLLDIVIWGLLFLLFNATNDRGFGAPMLRWKDILHCKFSAPKQIKLDDIKPDERIMKVDNLTKQYRGKKTNAIDDVSFEIKRGEIIVMIGPNGAGKSSIINTVSGAIPATKGTLTLGNDEPTERFSGIQNCLGIVFQDNVIISLLSIREHLEIFGRIRGIDEQTLQECIDFFADNLQLKEMLPNRAGDLSGGQKRKLCIALALLGNPPIIIMDEPTAGVDVQARQLIWKSISNLSESTCIITTHALEEAEAVSSRMFVISRGKIPFAGTSTELREEFKCGYIMKVDAEPEAMPGILEAVQKWIPEAKILEDREDTIALPVNNKIPDLLADVDSRREELGIDDYSFSVEQLEDVLLRILETN